MKTKKAKIKTKKSVKKSTATKSKKVLQPIELVMQKLHFKPFSCELNKSGICFYCDSVINECGCMTLELTEGLEDLSDDFKNMRIGNKMNSYLLLNTKITPKHGQNVIAYDTKAKKILYKMYGTAGTGKPALADVYHDYSFGPRLISHYINKNITIIGVEIACLYSGFLYSGNTAKEAEDKHKEHRAGWLCYGRNPRKSLEAA